MKKFSYFQPTEILFGVGRVKEIGKVISRFGNNCLLVTTATTPQIAPMYDRIQKILQENGIHVTHYDQVMPNPTTDIITAGAEIAQNIKADVILGVGGGSSMDSAKAIAVEATHDGSSWDYLYFRETQPTEKTVPIVAISTTSGTGSQVTQVAVVTNMKERDKSAIYNSAIFPRVAIVDPELMLTVPKHVTACTGFDVFCHAFESFLHPNSSPFIEIMAKKSIQLVIENLPKLLNDLNNIELRQKLALADTLAGLCIANAGVTLPHGVGMAISGMYPHVAHGESLAIIYPAFTRFTYSSAIPQFAHLGRTLNSQLHGCSDEKAAKVSCEVMDGFLKEIGLWMKLKDINMPEEEIPDLASASMRLPDYKSNPRVASYTEMLNLIEQVYG